MKHRRLTAASFAALLNPLGVLSPLASIAAWLTGALPVRGVDVPFTEQVISTAAEEAVSVFVTDVDGDGHTDVLSAPVVDSKIAWYENTTPPPAPDPLEAADDGLGGDYNRVGDFKAPTSAVAGGQDVAIRVKLIRMYIDSDEDPANGCPVGANFSSFENQVRYLGPPRELRDEGDPPILNFLASRLQCAPHFQDWSESALAAQFGPTADASVIYFYGSEMVPCSIYDVQQATQSCVDSGNKDCFSDPLEVRTALWGDVWPPFGFVDFGDIGRIVNKFVGRGFDPESPLSGAPTQARAILRGNVAPLTRRVDVRDLLLVISAFNAVAYTQPGPKSCPGVASSERRGDVAETPRPGPVRLIAPARAPHSPRALAPVCGDFMTEGCEQCDDGNALPGDGCGADCRCECVGICGDEVHDGCEECDDGNTTPGDGCDENCLVEGPVNAYFRLVPVSPQGGDSLPYPNCDNDSCISGPTITLPSGERRVWLEVRLGGWGPACIRGWQAVLDASSFCSGTGEPLQTFRQECDDQCACLRNVNDEGGTPCDQYPNLFPDTCVPGFQQRQQTFAIGGGAPITDNINDNLRAASFVVSGSPACDPGTEGYGATWVLNIPAGAAGTYTIKLNACGDTVMIDGGNQLVPIASLEPAMIVIEDAGVAAAGLADAPERGPNPFGLANGGRLNRFGAFRMPASYVAGGDKIVAIQVEIVDLYIDSDEDAVNGCPVRDSELPDLSTAFNGQVRYLGPPSAYKDNATDANRFVAARLQCTPPNPLQDWSPSALEAQLLPKACSDDLQMSCETDSDCGDDARCLGLDAGTIYFYGAPVVPCSVYEARYGDMSCLQSADPDACLSQALEIRTALWGDAWEPFGNINFTDIGAVVDAFKSIGFVPGCPPNGAPRKVRAMLRENSAPLDSDVNFTDIGRVVDSFKTIAYAEDGPTACP